MYTAHASEIDQLIKMRLARIYVPGYTYDDLVQEGRLAALEALDAYDGEKGPLAPYLTRVIAHAYYGLMSTVRAKKRWPESPPEGEEAIAALPADELNVEDTALMVEHVQEVRRAVQRAQTRLGDIERTVMGCYMEPTPELITTVRNLGRRKLSKSAVARYLGMSPDKLQAIIGRIQFEMSAGLVTA
jgi:RNA polymerase sigma factor (sigma-70 family)